MEGEEVRPNLLRGKAESPYLLGVLDESRVDWHTDGWDVGCWWDIPCLGTFSLCVWYVCVVYGVWGCRMEGMPLVSSAVASGSVTHR